MPGGDLEYLVLSALWQLNEATAREVFEEVGEPDGLAYTTIATVLDRLHTKRLVKRRKRGRAYVYRARIERAEIDGLRAQEVIEQMLVDDPVPAVAALVDAVQAVDPDLLQELAREIRRRRRRGT